MGVHKQAGPSGRGSPGVAVIAPRVEGAGHQGARYSREMIPATPLSLYARVYETY